MLFRDPSARGTAARGALMAVSCLTGATLWGCAPDLGFSRSEGATDAASADAASVDAAVDAPRDAHVDGSEPDAHVPIDGGGPAPCPAPNLLIAVDTSGATAVPGHVARFSLPADGGAPVACDALNGSRALRADAHSVAGPTPGRIVVVGHAGTQAVDIATDTVVWSMDAPFEDAKAQEAFLVESPEGGAMLVGTAWSQGGGDQLHEVVLYDHMGDPAERIPQDALPASSLLSVTQHPSDPTRSLVLRGHREIYEASLFDHILIGDDLFSSVFVADRIYAGHDGTRDRMTTIDDVHGVVRWQHTGDERLLADASGDCISTCDYHFHAVPDPRTESSYFALCSSLNINGPRFVVHRTADGCDMVFRASSIHLDARAHSLAITPVWGSS